MREKERWNGVGAVVRGSSEDAREVNNQLIFVACLPQGSRVISRPGLWPRAMSGSMFLSELGFMLASMIHAFSVTECSGSGNYRLLLWCPCAVPLLVSC